MTMSEFVAVNTPGGFGASAGGGGKHPRKPGASGPGKAHYQEATTSNAERARLKRLRKQEALAAKIRESTPEPGPSSPFLPDTPGVSKESDDSIEFVSASKKPSKFMLRYNFATKV